eukprot:47737-Pelagomonas_calceolata.AAC.2
MDYDLRQQDHQEPDGQHACLAPAPGGEHALGTRHQKDFSNDTTNKEPQCDHICSPTACFGSSRASSCVVLACLLRNRKNFRVVHGRPVVSMNCTTKRLHGLRTCGQHEQPGRMLTSGVCRFPSSILRKWSMKWRG